MQVHKIVLIQQIVETFESIAADTTSKALVGLANGVTYHVCLIATDAASNVAQAGAYSFTVDTEAPSGHTITGPADPINSLTPTVTWSDATGESKYDLYINAGSEDCTNSADSGTFESIAADTTSKALVGLANGVTYHVCLIATDAINNSAQANAYSFTVDTVPPTAPTITGPNDPTNNITPTISWIDATGESKYDLYFNAGSEDCTNSADSGGSYENIAADATSQVLAGLTDNTTYHICLLAKDAADNSTQAQSYSFFVNTSLPSITIADVSVNENIVGGNVDVIVSLSPTSASNVTVSYVTSNVTALAGTDYTYQSDTATIIAGQTSTTISIPIIDDNDFQDDITFEVLLSSPTNGAIINTAATVTILENDTPNIIHTAFERYTGSFYSLSYNKSLDNGVTFAGPITIDGGAKPSSHAKMAVDSQGNPHIIFLQDNGGANDDLTYTGSNNGGSTFTNLQTIENLTGSLNYNYSDTHYRIKVDNNDNLHVVYTQEDDSSVFRVYYTRSTDSGANWSAPITIDLNAANEAFFLDFKVSLEGILHLLYSENNTNNNIFYTRSTDSGTNWSTRARIDNGSAGGGYMCKMVLDQNDDLHFAYSYWASGRNQLFYRNSSDKGLTLNAETQIESSVDSQENPNLVIDSNNNPHIIFEMDNASVRESLYYSKSSNGGTSFSSALEVASGVGEKIHHAEIHIGNLNNPYVIWKDEDASSDLNLFFRSSDNGGTSFDTIKQIDDSTEEDYSDGDMTVDAAVNPFIVYTQKVGGVRRSFFRTSPNWGTSFFTPVQLAEGTPSFNSTLVVEDTIAPLGHSITGPSSMVNSTSPTVSWDDATGESKYNLYVNAGSEDCTVSADSGTYILTANTLSKTLAGLSNGVTYHVCLIASDNYSNTSQANAYSFTVDTEAPSGHSITAPTDPVDSATPTVTWSDATGESKYDLYINAGSEDCTNSADSGTFESIASDTTSQVLSGLSYTVTYHVCLIATDAAENSAQANSYNFTVQNLFPTVDTNTGFTANQYSKITITNSILSSSDPGDQTITYTLTTVPSDAIIWLSGNALEVNDTFTQADIDASIVTYSQSVATDKSFIFKISDSVNEVTGQTLSITGQEACVGLAGATSHTEIGVGTSNDWPYVICSTGQWSSFFGDSTDWDKDYFLGTNIDISSLAATYQSIGNATTTFTGTFDGNNNVIQNFTYNNSSTDYFGLFGIVNDGGIIKNIKMTNVSVTAKNATGALIGVLLDGTVTNVTISGNVSGVIAVGIVIGNAGDGTVSYVSSSGSVAGSTSVGGAIGRICGTITVTDSFSTADVTSNNIVDDPYYGVGGFVGGINDTGNCDGTVIERCFATGAINSDLQTYSDTVGGFSGLIVNADVSKSYATGKISTVGTSSVGGFIGYGVTELEQTYSTGKIYSQGDDGTIGGFAGTLAGKIHDSFTTSSVKGEGTTLIVGGFVGTLQEDTSGMEIFRSYVTNTATSSGSNTIGGFVGGNVMDGGSYTLDDTLWNKSLNAGLDSLGDSTTDPELKTYLKDELEDQNNYSGFDFVTTPVWKMPATGGTPILDYQLDGFNFDDYLWNDRPIGNSNKSSFAISGDCPIDGDAIVAYVNTDTYSDTCASNRWSMNIDVSSGFSDGNISVGVIAYNGGTISNSNVRQGIGRTFVLDTICATDTNGGPSFGSGGDGTSGDPWIICTKEEIESLWGKSEIWTDDFELHDYIDLTGASGAEAIELEGNFDGKNFEISNFTLNTPADSIVGFFGRIPISSSVVKNIGFVDPYVVGNYMVGVVAGEFKGALLDNVWARTTTITTNVSADSEAGGIVGTVISSGKIKNVRTNGITIAGVNYALGGLIGLVDTSTLTVLNSYVENTNIIASSSVASGTFIGETDSEVIISGVYSTGTISAEMQLGGIVGMAYDVLTISDSFSSSNITASSLGAGGILGYSTVPGTSISNCHSTGAITAEASEVGGIVGVMGTNTGDSYIANSYSTGDIDGGDDTELGEGTGGLAGNLERVIVTDSYSTSNVTGFLYVGGLIGFMDLAGSVTDSWSTGTVVGDSSVGGFIGKSYSPISKSWSSGNVTMNTTYDNDDAGGFIGGSHSSVENSYSTGDVSVLVSSDGNYIGGFIGGAYSGNIITNCYSIGDVDSSASSIGGFLGDDVGSYTNNYWNTDTSLATSKGSGAGEIEGKTTAQMQQEATFSSWDFTNIWIIDEGNDYPKFR